MRASTPPWRRVVAFGENIKKITIKHHIRCLTVRGSKRHLHARLRMDSARTRLAFHLRRLRRERGLSQEELAHLARLDRVTIGLIERNAKGVLLGTLDDLAAVLNADVGEFLTPIPPGGETEERPIRRVLPRVAGSPTTRGQPETASPTTRISQRRGPKRRDGESG